MELDDRTTATLTEIIDSLLEAQFEETVIKDVEFFIRSRAEIRRKELEKYSAKLDLGDDIWIGVRKYTEKVYGEEKSDDFFDNNHDLIEQTMKVLTEDAINFVQKIIECRKVIRRGPRVPE